MQITPENVEDESNYTIAAACTPFPEPTKTISIFCEFENMYKKVLEVQDHCPLMPNVANWHTCFSAFLTPSPPQKITFCTFVMVADVISHIV